MMGKVKSGVGESKTKRWREGLSRVSHRENIKWVLIFKNGAGFKYTWHW